MPSKSANGHHFGKAVLSFLFIICFFQSATFGAEQQNRKNILVLFSFRPTLPVAAQWNRGIRSVFDANKALETIINIEHLDLTHFNNEHHVELLLDLYRHKYSSPKPDLIIPVLNASVDLMLKYGADLFPGVPVVFGGVEKQFVDSRSLRSNFTGYLTDMAESGIPAWFCRSDNSRSSDQKVCGSYVAVQGSNERLINSLNSRRQERSET